MRTEMKKICEALERTALRKNDQNQLMEENASTPHTQLNSSTINESFDNGQSDHHNITEQRQQAENNARQMLLMNVPFKQHAPSLSHHHHQYQHLVETPWKVLVNSSFESKNTQKQ
ncbi:unnamed protein product [Rotaria magnacalcarata]|uniref:Uncharacterized protein n=2 Tax=Rotaria magnacalcarata TaxID=392030 RepID=A0A8S3I767_9BILA|nr:unnamed protein product [Rotaria magnacalcarata]